MIAAPGARAFLGCQSGPALQLFLTTSCERRMSANVPAGKPTDTRVTVDVCDGDACNGGRGAQKASKAIRPTVSSDPAGMSPTYQGSIDEAPIERDGKDDKSRGEHLG